MELEEAVIFEDSALALHFQECGISVNLEQRYNEDHEEKQLLTDIIRQKAGYALSLLREVINPTIKNKVNAMEVVDLLVKSKLLDVDDVAMLQNISLDEERLGSPEGSLFRKTCFEVMLPVVPGIISMLSPTLRKPGMYCSLLTFSFLLYRWRNVIYGSLDLKNLRKVLNKTVVYEAKLKSALTAIIDQSTIHQGYLMTRDSSHIWNLEAGEIRELAKRSRSVLPGLRVALHSTTRRIATEYSRATFRLRSDRPLPAHLDSESFYLPDFDDESMDETDTLMKMKDGKNTVNVPTIRSLKNSVDILRFKRSEFFRRLVLGAILPEMRESASLEFSHSLYKVTMDSIKELELGLLLRNTYIRKPILEEKISLKRNSLGLDVENSCKSCSLHLQEALYYSRKLEDTVDSIPSANFQGTHELTESVAKVFHHITSANMCMKHSQILCEKLYAPVCVRNDEIDDLNVGHVDNHFSQPVEPDISLSEVIPQDEIFEMCFGEDDPPPKISDENLLDVFEVDRECTQILMTELKDVLKVRAAVWEEREEKAKRRQNTVNLESQSEGSDSEVYREKMSPSTKYAEYGGKGAVREIGEPSRISLLNVVDPVSPERKRSDLNAVTSAQKISHLNERSLSQVSKNYEASTILNKLDFDGTYFACIVPKEKAIDSGSRESTDRISEGESGLGVRALAAEVVAKARATKSLTLLEEEEFTFLGAEED